MVAPDAAGDPEADRDPHDSARGAVLSPAEDSDHIALAYADAIRRSPASRSRTLGAMREHPTAWTVPKHRIESADILKRMLPGDLGQFVSAGVQQFAIGETRVNEQVSLTPRVAPTPVSTLPPMTMSSIDKPVARAAATETRRLKLHDPLESLDSHRAECWFDRITRVARNATSCSRTGRSLGR
jgi:hypothetical protein